MSSPFWGGAARERLTGNIALLQMLSKEPERPAENPPPLHLINQVSKEPQRLLSFERERDLVDNLAFLSASSDRPEEVTAVCVEELDDREGLIIRVARNTGDISSTKEGFRRMAAILQGATSLRQAHKLL